MVELRQCFIIASWGRSRQVVARTRRQRSRGRGRRRRGVFKKSNPIGGRFPRGYRQRQKWDNRPGGRPGRPEFQRWCSLVYIQTSEMLVV